MITVVWFMFTVWHNLNEYLMTQRDLKYESFELKTKHPHFLYIRKKLSKNKSKQGNRNFFNLLDFECMFSSARFIRLLSANNLKFLVHTQQTSEVRMSIVRELRRPNQGIAIWQLPVPTRNILTKTLSHFLFHCRNFTSIKDKWTRKHSV